MQTTPDDHPERVEGNASADVDAPHYVKCPMLACGQLHQALTSDQPRHGEPPPPQPSPTGP
ncbi:hypothetical protein ACFVDU_21860 [Streptomyces albidoflavus]